MFLSIDEMGNWETLRIRKLAVVLYRYHNYIYTFGPKRKNNLFLRKRISKYIILGCK